MDSQESAGCLMPYDPSCDLEAMWVCPDYWWNRILLFLPLLSKTMPRFCSPWYISTIEEINEIPPILSLEFLSFNLKNNVNIDYDWATEECNPLSADAYMIDTWNDSNFKQNGVITSDC